MESSGNGRGPDTNSRPVGLVNGPGETAQQFTFISRDPDRVLRAGEFVTYQVETAGRPRTVFARVVERVPVRRFPDSFLANPEVSPDAVGRLVGYSGNTSEIFELTAETLGYYDRGFINPRIPPEAGTRVYLAPDDLLREVLTRRGAGERGAAEIGWLLSREPGQVPIVVDVNAIVATHLAILASTGSGKSYLAAVLIEEMLKPNNRAAIIVIDPHGEYDTLTQMVSHAAFQQGRYQPAVKICRPGEVKMRYGTLTFGDLAYLLPGLSDRMRHVLGRAFRTVRRRSRRLRQAEDWWTLGELVDALQEIAAAAERENEQAEHDVPLGDDEEASADPFDANTARALMWRLDEVLRRSKLFHDSIQNDLTDIVRPGGCTVLQFDDVDEREQQVMVAALLRRLYDARRATAKGEASREKNGAFYLPYPVFTLIEEGHHFAPAQATDAVSTGILKTILAEGRKFGVGVGIISQRPGKLNADVLSQCRTQFLMAIINPLDQQRVAESVESAGRDTLKELPALTKGQVIITGPAVNTPVLAQVRERHTEHGAADPRAADEWADYFSEGAESRRERETAFVETAPPDDLDEFLFGGS